MENEGVAIKAIQKLKEAKWAVGSIKYNKLAFYERDKIKDIFKVLEHLIDGIEDRIKKEKQSKEEE